MSDDAAAHLVRGAVIDAMSGVAVLYCPHPGDEGPACPDCITERVLSALATAGRLSTPAETRTEYVVIVDGDATSEPYGDREFAQEVAEAYGTHRAFVARRQCWVGPWLPVPTEEDTDRG